MIIFCLVYCILSISFNESDLFKVFYLRAPLFHALVGDVMVNFDAFHFGIGFKNVRTGEEFATDFCGEPGIMDSIIPKYDEGSGKFVWKDYTKLYRYDKIDRKYWVAVIELYEADGKILKTFFNEFVDVYNKTDQGYKLFSIVADKKIVMDSFNCVDYMTSGLTFLVSLGARKTCKMDRIKIDYINLYVKDIPVLIEKSEESEKEIRDFYMRYLGVLSQFLGTTNPEQMIERKEKIMQKGLEEVILRTSKAIQNVYKKFIYRHSGKYYRIEIIPPYASFDFDEWKIPE